MPLFSVTFVVTTLILLFSILPSCLAHGFLIHPISNFKTIKKAECRVGGPPHSPNDKCRGPCIAKTSWQYDPNHKRTTYRRGQPVTFEWTINNHRGGFVRFTLVPESQRMNHAAHNAGTFLFACFEAGTARCLRGKLCGTDKKGLSARIVTHIPTSVKDGNYVLGWSWFGGLQKGKSYFGDYWSCADVRIAGGAPITKAKKPMFKPGRIAKGVKGVTKNSCLSSVDRLGPCRREPCYGKPARLRKPHGIKGTISNDNDDDDNAPIPRNEDMNKGSASPKISMLRLVNTKTGAVIAKKFDKVVRVSRGTQVALVAQVSGKVRRVTCFVAGKRKAIESVPPYSCFGDSGKKIRAWPNPPFGRAVKVRVEAEGFGKKKNVLRVTVRLARR